MLILNAVDESDEDNREYKIWSQIFQEVMRKF